MTSRPITFALAALNFAVAPALMAQPVGFPPAPPLVSPAQGAIDFHVHSEPDVFGRSMDDIDVAVLAKRKGMRALVLKNHVTMTADRAVLLMKVVPGIEIYGGIVLNNAVGGINPAAVEHMTKVTGGWGRLVWMPTFDSENQVRYSKEKRPFVSVSRNGELLPAVREVIALIAKHNLVLATGHSAAEEGLMLVRDARRQGVQRMVVTHAMNPPIAMTVAQMREATQLGAFIEFVGSSPAAADASGRYDRFADAIRQVGPEFCILSSDLGQMGNPLPAEGFGAFLVALRARGFSEQDIDRMAKQNPARLLGLR